MKCSKCQKEINIIEGYFYYSKDNISICCFCHDKKETPTKEKQMAIIVTEEPDPTPPYESCCKCGDATTFWYEPNDVALCPRCSGKYDDKDIPTKEQWLKSTIGDF